MSNNMSPSPSAPGAGNPASMARVFLNRRKLPLLPGGYDWETQKKLYSPQNLVLGPSAERVLDHKSGLVFCHRGLYERASRIVENSSGAIDNGTKQGLFLHEIDGFVPERLNSAPVAHDKIARRVSRHNKPWDEISVHERYITNLVTRNIERPIVDPEIPDQPTLPGQPGAFGPPDFASSYLDTDEKVLALFDVLWKEKFEPNGLTLQYDLRDNDLANAIPYYSFHLSKLSELAASGEEDLVRGRSLVRSLFQSVMLKGYNVVYKSFNHLVTFVEAASCAQYGYNHFERKQLLLFPPMIMVFHAQPIIDLARETEPVDPGLDRESYDHIYDVAKRQIMSYVDINTGDGGNPYNFVLEITHSGLGLGYRGNAGAKNPLNGRPIRSRKVLLDSLVDRVLIDIAEELRKTYPNLLFSSCTRLPDYIVDKQKNKANWQTSGLEPWKDPDQDETGIEAELRAIHGGLYPQSNIVVADDPWAEMAARTWIDQEFELDRRELLTKDVTYYDWLARGSGRKDLQGSRHRETLVETVKTLNASFEANTFGEAVVDVGPSLARPSPTIPADRILQWKADLDTQENFENPRRVDTGDSSYPEDVWTDGGSTRADQNEQPAFAIRINRRKRLVSIFPADANRALSLLRDQAVVPVPQGASSNGADVTTAIGTHVTEIVVDGIKFVFSSKSSASKEVYGSESQRAAFEDNHERLRKLIADPTSNMSNPKHMDCATALGIACEQRRISTIRLLLGHMPDISFWGFNGYPLTLACAKGHEDVVEMLLDHGAKVNITLIQRRSPLAAACEKGHHKIVSRLLREGAELSSNSSYCPVAQAASNGHKDVVETLLNHQRRSGNTTLETEMVTRALHDACLHGQNLVVDLLLRRGADVNLRNNPWHSSPLQAACYNGHKGIIVVLLEHNATIDFVLDGQTALHIACARGHYAIAELLLKSGARFKDWAEPIDSPLSTAYGAGNTSIVELLLGRGAPDIVGRSRSANTQVAMAERVETYKRWLALRRRISEPSESTKRLKLRLFGIRPPLNCGCLTNKKASLEVASGI